MSEKIISDSGNIAVELSRRCNVKCPHCLTGANPRVKERLSYPQIGNYLNQIKVISNGVSFSGGEPFVFLDRLKFAIQEATRLGLKKAIVTNAFWADSQEKAEYILNDIGDSGKIEWMNISTDIFHEHFTPFSNVVNAVSACKRLGIDVKIRIFHVGFNKQAQHRAISLIRRRLKEAGEKNIEIYSQPLVAFDGMRIDKRQIGMRYSSRLPVKNSCTALRTIFIAYSGDVYPCCGGIIRARYQKAVILGNINERPLKGILNEAKKSFLPNFLLRFGPQGLIRLLRTTKGHDFTKSLLHNIQSNDACHLCTRLFSFSEIVSLIGTMRNKSNGWAHKSD